MQKKMISSVIASAAAMSAAMVVDAAPKPNAAVGLDNPLDSPPPDCAQDQDGFTAHWWDPDDDEGTTKYGGDIEFDAQLYYVCNAGEESFEGSETASVDVELSRDASDPFSYECESTEDSEIPEQVACWAHIDWEDISSAVNDAAEDKYGDLAEGCTMQVTICDEYEEEICVEEHVETVAGEFYTYGATLENVAFGVKEMNPGKGKGKQNYEKAFAYCEFTPAP